MTIINAKIITCPHCGFPKELMALGSSNTIGAKFWSDLKVLAPMGPTNSPVQRCASCGKFFLGYKQEYTEGAKKSFEQGILSYWEWKEAYIQFCSELGNAIDEKDLKNIKGWLLQSYNDYFYRGKQEIIPSKNERSFIRSIILDLIANVEWGETDNPVFPSGVCFDDPAEEKLVWSSRLNPIIKIELYRELGDFQKSFDLYHSLIGERMELFDAQFARGVKQKLDESDSKVFKFYDDSETVQSTDVKNDTVIHSQDDNGIAVVRTMIKCPKCGRFSPGDECIYCGTNLYEPLYKSQNNITDNMETELDNLQTGGYKVCHNGHYYIGDFCPYCIER